MRIKFIQKKPMRFLRTDVRLVCTRLRLLCVNLKSNTAKVSQKSGGESQEHTMAHCIQFPRFLTNHNNNLFL